MKISIVTATYNSENTIKHCLDSVAEQSVISCIEHIIVDGGSGDNTLTILSDYQHINKVISEKDEGIYDAFNKGMQLATGEIIYYLNSDDMLLEHDAIEGVIDTFSKTDINFLVAPVLMCDSQSGAQWLQHPRTIELNGVDTHYPSHQGFFMRTAILKQLGGFPRCFNLVADSYVMLKTMLLYNGVFSSKPVAKFFTGGVSSHIDNQHEVEHELGIIFDLLGINKKNDYKSLDRSNFMQLRNLFIDHLSESKTPKLLNKYNRIGIFGTGVMSSLIMSLIRSYGYQIAAFYTSNGMPSYFLGKSVFSLEKIDEIDLIINCIEGEHASEINDHCKDINPNIHVVRWFDIFADD